ETSVAQTLLTLLTQTSAFCFGERGRDRHSGVDAGTGLKRISHQTVRDSIASYARDHSYHPVLEYLEALTWDGAPRLENWLITYLGAEQTPYATAIGHHRDQEHATAHLRARLQGRPHAGCSKVRRV